MVIVIGHCDGAAVAIVIVSLLTAVCVTFTVNCWSLLCVVTVKAMVDLDVVRVVGQQSKTKALMTVTRAMTATTTFTSMPAATTTPTSDDNSELPR